MASKALIAGARIDAMSLHEVVNRIRRQIESPHADCLVTFVNPGSVAFGLRNEAFRSDLSKFDLVLPDGIGLVKALALRGFHSDRISFDSTSLAPHVFRIAQDLKKTVMLVGGSPGVARFAARNLLVAFPDLKVAHTFDGFEEVYKAEKCAVEESVNIVICAMGGGAQERFLLRLRSVGWSGCGFTCGGYFDQLSSGMNYYPDWINKRNLRWAYRLYKEPRRLWKRYTIDYSLFIAAYIRESMSQLVSGRQHQTAED